MSHDPPFDEKPCPMCPSEIRNLHAVAHNFLSAWDAFKQYGESYCKVVLKIEDLRSAVKAAQVLSDVHFADRKHSHGY